MSAKAPDVFSVNLGENTKQVSRSERVYQDISFSMGSRRGFPFGSSPPATWNLDPVISPLRVFKLPVLNYQDQSGRIYQISLRLN